MYPTVQELLRVLACGGAPAGAGSAVVPCRPPGSGNSPGRDEAADVRRLLLPHLVTIVRRALRSTSDRSPLRRQLRQAAEAEARARSDGGQRPGEADVHLVLARKLCDRLIRSLRSGCETLDLRATERIDGNVRG